MKYVPFRTRLSRTFLIGFLVLVLLMEALDWYFAGFQYIREVDRLLIAAYGLFWLLLYWFRPDFFRDN